MLDVLLTKMAHMAKKAMTNLIRLLGQAITRIITEAVKKTEVEIITGSAASMDQNSHKEAVVAETACEDQIRNLAHKAVHKTTIIHKETKIKTLPSLKTTSNSIKTSRIRPTILNRTSSSSTKNKQVTTNKYNQVIVAVQIGEVLIEMRTSPSSRIISSKIMLGHLCRMQEVRMPNSKITDHRQQLDVTGSRTWRLTRQPNHNSR